MPINITMPALSPTMEEGSLAKWLVKEGDNVAPGDVIAEIETDKATMEVEAVDEGKVGKILVAEGSEGVKVNALIAILLEEGEDGAALSDLETGKAENLVQTTSARSETGDQAIELTPSEKPPTGSMPSSSISSLSDISADVKAGPVPVKGGTKVFASPLARRIAQNGNIDITAISGSGPRGRIVKRDVEAALANGSQPIGAKTQASTTTPVSSDVVLKNFEEGSYELVKHDGMRKTIAKRLQESKQTIPHFYVTMDCELDSLLALRKQLNEAAPITDEKPAYKLSVNDMVIKALAMALRDVPDANVSWTDENMVKHKHADVGVAVSIPGGLITPIVRHAETKTLSVISNEMKDLANRAKDRKLNPAEYQGGTTAVSNMGMMGVKNFSAVVNPPHATILAVGAGEKRPIVKDGELTVATVMSVTLSTDHRCVDGALGAELLGRFKSYIENPVGMLI